MKTLMMIAGMLAALLVAAVPAFSQPYEAEEIEVTGVVEKKYSDLPLGPETGLYFINDEETGAERPLLECGIGSVENLEDFVGERVTVTGIPQTQGNDPSNFPDPNEIPMCVSAVELLGDSAQGEYIYGTADPDYLTDTAGNDTVYALGAGDTISAGHGNDILYGGTGWDYVVGGYGNDTLYGWKGSDWLDGGAGNDFVYGWTGNDLVDGGTGDDEVYGGVGNDTVYGFDGYDVCVVGPEDSAYGCEKLYRQ